MMETDTQATLSTGTVEGRDMCRGLSEVRILGKSLLDRIFQKLACADRDTQTRAIVLGQATMGARPPGIPVREFPGIADPQNSRREFPGISDILAGITGNL